MRIQVFEYYRGEVFVDDQMLESARWETKSGCFNFETDADEIHNVLAMLSVFKVSVMRLICTSNNIAVHIKETFHNAIVTSYYSD